MDHERLRLGAKPGIICLLLLTLCLVCQFLHAQVTGPVLVAFQAKEPAGTDQGPRSGIQDENGAQEARNPVGPSELTASRSQLAPPARPRPFLRLAAILLIGLVTSAARLARRFRRFLGLGVFANAYSALFLMLAVGISGFPVTFEATLSSHLGSWLGPWIADLSGIIAALILPMARLRARAAPVSPVPGLDLASSNPVLAALEDGIRDHILGRMQAEIVIAARRYSWDEIKRAARRVLEEEITVGRLDHQEGEVAIQSTEAFQPSADPHVDVENKYSTLVRLLRSCSFSRLRLGLAAATRETVA